MFNLIPSALATAARSAGRDSAYIARDHSRPEEYGYRVVGTFPHDPLAYTQGLEIHEGALYESTGLHGRSSLRRVNLETGEVLQQLDLADEHFGEGITVLFGKIIQLTWRSQIGFVYELPTFRLVHQFKYPGEGWGLTNDGSCIFMSDGTAVIRCWDATTLQELSRINVRDGDSPISGLNELEFVLGELFANVYATNRIARISPNNGRVIGWIDLTGLLSDEDRQQNADVPNGIAFDGKANRLFVTGKLWPKLFEIELVPRLAR